MTVYSRTLYATDRSRDMDEDEYGSSVREARSRRKNIREHADEISKAQQMKLDSGAGLDYEREGEKVTGVAGEEEATFEETERVSHALPPRPHLIFD